MEEKISAFLRAAHPSRSEDPASSPDLFREGWMDSLLQLRLLTFLEEEYKITIPAFQLSLSNFSRVSAIAALVHKLQNAGFPA